MGISIPKSVEKIANTLIKSEYKAYYVGGCVRDSIIKKNPKDWDITTNATPEEIQKIFPDSFYENNFGTVGVKNREAEDESLSVIEITPFRKEGEYTDKRHPDEVIFTDKVEEDLGRRDFTINAVAIDAGNGEVVDPYSGIKDIKDKIVRTVGDADKRFSEDALRMLRAVRLSSELNFIVSQETVASIHKNSGLLSHISKERIRDEFNKIIMSNDPEYGLIMLQKLGILSYIIPELEEGIGMEQNQAHAFDVWTHLIKSVQAAAKKGWPLHIRLAALLHDVGKPKSRRKGNSRHKWTFYGHDVIGSRIAEKALKSLKYPNETIELVSKLVRWHMFFSDTETITHSAVRRLITQVGKDHIWELMDLRVCDRIGTGRPKESPYRLRKYHAMIEEVMRDPISVGMLKIGGKEIMENVGENPGPRIGYILHALLELVLEDPKLNEKEKLIELAKDLKNKTDGELKKLGDSGKEKKDLEDEKEVKLINKKHYV